MQLLKELREGLFLFGVCRLQSTSRDSCNFRDHDRHAMQEGDLDEGLQKQLQAGFPELEEWTSLSTVRRMLRASNGNLAQSTVMLMKAIECRVRERELFQCMRCKVGVSQHLGHIFGRAMI